MDKSLFYILDRVSGEEHRFEGTIAEVLCKVISTYNINYNNIIEVLDDNNIKISNISKLAYL